VPDPGSLPQFPPDSTTAAPVQSNNYAGWWIRVPAFVLDGIVVAAVAVAISSALGLHTPLDVIKLHTVNGQQRLVPIGHKLVEYDLVKAAVGITYVAAFLSSAWQSTPFMRVWGLRVVRADDGGAVDLRRAALRAGAYEAMALLAAVAPILALVVIVDLLWPLWDARHQTLHDKLAGTVVVSTRPR
jgi:uncharacterized RDD family membrane protein YckC